MARVDIERKRATRWPWFLGLGLLVLALWGVTTLLRENESEEPLVDVPTVEDTHPPAAIPAPPVEEGGATASVRPIHDLAPLEESDVGQHVRAEGPVVATGNTGFWLLAGNAVVRIESARRVRRGDTLAVEGTLQRADPEETERISDVLGRHPESGQWSIVSAVKLVESGAAGTAADDAAARDSEPPADAEVPEDRGGA